MKKLASIQFLVLVPLLFVTNICAQDFKIAPATPLPEGSNFYNVSIASDTNNGFLVTWMNQRGVAPIIDIDNYACRVSKTGEVLDSTAIFLCSPVWANYCPSAVFAGGNWIIATNRGWLDEYIGVQRLTPSGTLLDNEPVNVLTSTGGATIIDPILATNGQEILCIAGVADDSLFASIFDPDLHILVDRFGLFPKTGTSTRCYRAISDGENFYVTFMSTNPYDPGNKLIIINPKGEILSVQTEYSGSFPTLTEVDNTIYVTSFITVGTTKLYLKRYNSEGVPLDSSPFIISEFQDFGPIVEKMYQFRYGYVDFVSTDKSFFLFWPIAANPGMSMIHFQSDFLASEIHAIDSQCQIVFTLPVLYKSSFSLIRASSIGGNVLTAWIDGREGDTRVYGNFVNVGKYTGVESKEDRKKGPEDFSISQNYPNPFNFSTTIQFEIRERATVRLFIYDVAGRLINTLVNEAREPACYTVGWDGIDLMGKPVASGVYFSRFDVITQDKRLHEKVIKMILIR